MGVDDLLCARCRGRVADGGCNTCRAAGTDLRRRGLTPGPTMFALLLAIALLLLLALHHAG